MNPFGPQGSHAATTMPSGNTSLRYGTSDTWVKDCSATGANDGTNIDAAFFNNIIGNLNTLIVNSAISPVTRGDMSLVWRAVRAAIVSTINSMVSGGGLTVTNDGKLVIAAGTSTLPFITA
jgi:hypothetical protein